MDDAPGLARFVVVAIYALTGALLLWLPASFTADGEGRTGHGPRWWAAAVLAAQAAIYWWWA